MQYFLTRRQKRIMAIFLYKPHYFLWNLIVYQEATTRQKDIKMSKVQCLDNGVWFEVLRSSQQLCSCRNGQLT